MKLKAQKIPKEFARTLPRGFRIVKKQGLDFLLVESLFCPNGHNLTVDSVRIHNEPSVKLKVIVNGQSGLIFVDAFWGSHAKLFSFIPQFPAWPTYVEAHCPYCDESLVEGQPCEQPGCGSDRSVTLRLPGGRNKIHVCARLGCPGHVLDITDMPHEVVESVNSINYFGAGPEGVFEDI